MTTQTPEHVIACAFARSHNLPEWMQIPALGRDMTPLGELAANALRAEGLLVEPLSEDAAKVLAQIPAAADNLARLRADLVTMATNADGWGDDDALGQLRSSFANWVLIRMDGTANVTDV